MIRKLTTTGVGLALLFSWLVQATPTAHALVREIVFPVLGGVHYSSDFGAPRTGHTHEGNDIFGTKMQPLVAAADGHVRWVQFPEASWGWGIELADEDGWRYRYLHINNDTPGTDDGMGGGNNAYAPGMIDGAPVKAGQLIGYLGDSGNAETTNPHLHFEVRDPDGVAVDPYPTLQAARHLATAVPRDPLHNEFFPYSTFTGGASIAVGDVTTDFAGEEIITGAGPGGAPHLRIFKSYNKRVVNQFYAYTQRFHGGIDVASADTNGDGVNEIITAPLAGRSPLIRVFSANGKVRHQFYAFDKTETHGVHVAAADLDGDGKAEIVTALASGTRPIIRVFTRKGELKREFLAYSSSFRGGVDVAAYPLTDETTGLIVTAAGPTGGPHIRIFGQAGKLKNQFFAYDENFRGGVRVSIADAYFSVDGPEIYTAPASNGGPDFGVFRLNGSRVDRLRGFEEWWKGGFDIAAGNDAVYAATITGNRQVSVWELH